MMLLLMTTTWGVIKTMRAVMKADSSLMQCFPLTYGFQLDYDLLKDPLFIFDGQTGYLAVSSNQIIRMQKMSDYSAESHSPDSHVLDYTR